MNRSHFRVAFLLIGVLSVRVLAAQEVFSPIFKNGDAVSFVGNSITQSGGFQHYIYLYHATRFPDHKVTFYNCGVGGDMAADILKRIHNDVLSGKPDHLVLMVGMNDVNRPLYAEKMRGDTAIARRKNQALETYRRNSEELVRQFKNYTSGVTLLRPSIYDQTAALATENMYGVNDALGLLGEHIANLGIRYRTEVVDFWSVMNDINIREQKRDPKFTIVGNDRIHPGKAGHLVMAYQFLKTKKAPAYVSSIVINTKRKDVETINCKITDLVRKPGYISFRCLEGSLPFPVPDDARDAISLVPFQDDLNQEIVKISGLKTGMYDVLIDNVHVGAWPANDLEAGVNLALISHTPQHQQAMKVLDQCVLIRRLQGNLRLLKRVENRELEQMKATLTLEAVGKYLSELLENKYKNERYDFNRKLFADYMAIKPQEHQIEGRLPGEVDKLYTMNRPTTHFFEIRKHE